MKKYAIVMWNSEMEVMMVVEEMSAMANRAAPRLSYR
jgi:hypothetical protein